VCACVVATVTPSLGSLRALVLWRPGVPAGVEFVASVAGVQAGGEDVGGLGVLPGFFTISVSPWGFIVCLLLQDLLQSCSRVVGRRVEDMCYERRRAEACVDEPAHHALVNAGVREIV